MVVTNAVYQFAEEKIRIRIIDVSLPDDLCAYVHLEAALAVPILESISALEEELENNHLFEIVDPYFQIIEDRNLSDVVKSKRDENWRIIQIYWEKRRIEFLNKSTRMKLFEEIADIHNLSLGTVRRMFSRFWQRGMTLNACIADYSNSGAPGKEKVFKTKTGKPRLLRNKDDSLGINIDEKIKKQFEYVINKYYRTKQLKSLWTVYVQLLEEFYSYTVKASSGKWKILKRPSNAPSYDQFYYWFKKHENPEKDIRARHGDKEYELTSRPILNDTRQEAPGPGFRFQTDSTTTDDYTVQEIIRSRGIGKPITYFMIDVFSRMITGVYTGLESDSWDGALMVLDSMVANKVDLCANYDIQIDDQTWPCSHLPEAIIADRGAFKGHGSDNLIINFKVKVENTSPYRADMKGIVERFNRSFNTKVKEYLPGAVMKDFRKRGDPDYRHDAALTMKEIRRFALFSVLEHNLKPIDDYELTAEMIRDNVRPIPLEIWQWGIAKQKGCLRKVDPLTFRMGILPRGKATLNDGAVTFHKLHYGASELIIDSNHLKIKERKVEVIFDPRNISHIYMVKPGGKGHILLNLLERSRSFEDYSLEEVLEANRRAADLKRSAEDSYKALAVKFHQEYKKIATDAIKATKEQQDSSIPKSKLLKQTRSNRAEEQSRLQKEEAFIKPESKDKPGEIADFPVQDRSNIGNKTDDSKPESTIDLIGRLIDEQRNKQS